MSKAKVQSTDLKSDAKVQPRALIHRNILDEAENQPKASINELASNISGATPNLVERVLDEYGDPCGTASEQQPETAQPVMSDNESLPSIDDLTETQRKVLEKIHEYPSATQRELGEQFDVSSATICTHVNSIEGFKWSDRKEFVEKVVPSNETWADGGNHPTAHETETSKEETRNAMEQKSQMIDNEPSAEFDELRSRLLDVEKRLEVVDEETNPVFKDPNLTHKVIHACMKSESISEKEELRIIEGFI